MDVLKDILGDVRVRFAPSPTGFLHVGGARTAIFNWLFAKSQNGKFLLRIEDTDPVRSKIELSEQIIRSLDWLNIHSDEPTFYQSDRINRYEEVISDLLKGKKAYYAFESLEELEQIRKKDPKDSTTYKYDRSALKLSQKTVNEYLAQGKSYTIRFLIPEGKTTFNDLVHGETTFDNSELDDFVLLRSDGSPVYQVAVIVDDHDMKITHVIRGDDHLSNTPKQILLYRAMGWEPPVYAHLPLIIDEDKRKLSKRRNPVAVEDYRELGFLSEALFNFLTLLGYAPQDNKEIISRNELINSFSFTRVNKKSAVFDISKLKWINSEYIKTIDEKIIVDEVIYLLKKKFPGEYIQDIPRSRIESAVHLLKERVLTLLELIEYGKYFFKEPVTYDEKGIKKYWDKNARENLKEYLELLKTKYDDSTFGNKDVLEKDLRDFADRKQIKAGTIIHPLRLSITGLTVSPGIFDVMEALGKETVIARIERFINTVEF